MKTDDKDRILKIFKNLDVSNVPFNVNPSNISEVGLDIAENLNDILKALNDNISLKWCLSTVKKAKVFSIVYQCNEKKMSIYKEEIAKKLPEYSYKTIATIVDEGIAKGFYVSLDPYDAKISDKKIKNIRPSLEVITAFYKWNFHRISATYKIINKFK